MLTVGLGEWEKGFLPQVLSQERGEVDATQSCGIFPMGEAVGEDAALLPPSFTDPLCNVTAVRSSRGGVHLSTSLHLGHPWACFDQ